MNFMDAAKRVELKNYAIVINDVLFSVKAKSMSQALKEASDILLDEADTVIVRREA